MSFVEPQHDRPTVTVDVYSDLVCPWCYIGKRRFEAALDRVGDRLEADVEITYKPYQLDPTAAPGVSTPVFEAYSRKFGGAQRATEIIDHVTTTAAADGLEFHMDKALRANTLLAHRLLWLAAQPGSPVAQEPLKERLLKAYFTDGLAIGDPDVLAECAAEVGFDRADVDEFLSSDRGTAEVQTELAEARESGITAVPTYVFNDRWAVPGAQDPETFVRVLEKMAEKAAEAPSPAGDA